MRIWLKTLRDSAQLTQKQVADALAISDNYYCLIEKGERQKEISLSLLTKLANIFNVPLTQLIEEENKLNQITQ